MCRRTKTREDKRNTNPRLTCRVKSKTQNLLKGHQNSKKPKINNLCLGWAVDEMGHYLRFNRVKNSSRVLALDRIHPSIQLVVVVLLTFCTPRITMQRWEDSITTPTPRGWRTSEIANATCLVRRSWTWSLRENISARRASFDNPRTRRSGMYPICICKSLE